MRTPFTFFISALLLLAGIAPAQAAEVYATGRAYLYTGPGNEYAQGKRVTRGERLDLIGCEKTLNWCAVRTLENDIGWIDPNSIRTPRRGYSAGYTVFDMKADGSLRIVIFKPHNRPPHYPYHPGKPKPRPERPPVAEKPAPEQKYKSMLPSKGYNPLCPMGVKDC